MEGDSFFEGWVLYVAIVVPVLAGMLVCYGRSMFVRLSIIATAIVNAQLQAQESLVLERGKTR